LKSGEVRIYRNYALKPLDILYMPWFFDVFPMRSTMAGLRLTFFIPHLYVATVIYISHFRQPLPDEPRQLFSTRIVPSWPPAGNAALLFCPRQRVFLILRKEFLLEHSPFYLKSGASVFFICFFPSGLLLTIGSFVSRRPLFTYCVPCMVFRPQYSSSCFAVGLARK